MSIRSNYIVIILLVLNLVAISYLYFYEFKQPLAQCLNDPLVYGYNELQSQNNDKLFCSCRLDSQYPSPILWFDEKGRRFD